MSNVKALPGVQVNDGSPNESLVEMLEDILADAKSGVLQSFCGVGFRSDGLRVTCFMPHENYCEMVGGIEALKFDYMVREADHE